jgi:hypothetical protein
MSFSDVKVRDHGLADLDDFGGVEGAPKVIGPAGVKCPNCGCADTCSIEVTVRHRMLRNGWGIGVYMGCPACPWAGPCVYRTAAAADKVEPAVP